MDIFEIEYMADEDTHRRLSKAVAKDILTGIDEGEAYIVGKLNGDKTMLLATDLFNRDAMKVLFDGIEYIYKEDKYVPIETIAIDKDVEAILNEEADILLTDDERAELEPINDKNEDSSEIEFDQIQENQQIEFAEDFYYGSVDNGADPILMGSTKAYAELETQGLINDDELEIPAGTQCRVEYIDHDMEILVLDFKGAKIRLEADPAVIKFKLVGTNESKNESDYEYEWEEFIEGKRGGFLRALAKAFQEADLNNCAKLANAFPEVYKVFAEFKGDVLNILDKLDTVDYRGLEMGHDYELCQPLLYGHVADYIIDNGLSDEEADRIKKYTNKIDEIEFPIGTKFSVIDTEHGVTMIEIDGFTFDCIFEDDMKFRLIG